jgi:hypothetical protein
MKVSTYILGVAIAATLVVACSSSTTPATTYAIAGVCGPLKVVQNTAAATPTLNVDGGCALGPAGNFVLETQVPFQPGASGSITVDAGAAFIQGTDVLSSNFAGQANVHTSGTTANVDLSGTFTYSGGTGKFSDATGSASADGGIVVDSTTLSITGSLNLTGSVTY